MMASVFEDFAPAAGGYSTLVGREVRALLSSLVVVDGLKWKITKIGLGGPHEVINKHLTNTCRWTWSQRRPVDIVSELYRDSKTSNTAYEPDFLPISTAKCLDLSYGRVRTTPASPLHARRPWNHRNTAGNTVANISTIILHE